MAKKFNPAKGAPIDKDFKVLHEYKKDAKFTGKELGRGSYGTVYEVTINRDQICAGKIIHPILLGLGPDSNIGSKYLQECELMSKLDHPNIAKFLGVCLLPKKSAFPVLLMEKLEKNLDEYLEGSQSQSDSPKKGSPAGAIPFAIKRSYLEDVARGLDYLHCEQKPPIIHRDLTARNVLLTKDLQVAKITDFGNARFLDLKPGQLLTQFPGTLVYMPPEICSGSQTYDPSLDIFSFGHLALFVGLQIFPGELDGPNIVDTQSGKLIALSEVERRGKYFEQLEKQQAADQDSARIQALVALIKKCLDNDPQKRYESKGLLSALQQMRVTEDPNIMLERKIQHWNDVAKRKDPIVLVVTGKPGAGKSTLLNNFLGPTFKGEKAETGHGGGSVTQNVKEYIHEINGITVKIIDMPGLGAGDHNEEKVKTVVAELNAYTNNGKADLLLYCISMVGGRMNMADEKTITVLNQAFKGNIWEKTILVLTHADLVIVSDSDDEDDQKNEKPVTKLEALIDSFCKSFRNALHKAGINTVKDVQNGMLIKDDLLDPSILIAMPAGKKPSKNPANWMPMLFREVLKRCDEDAIPALFELRGMMWDKMAYFLSMKYVKKLSDFAFYYTESDETAKKNAALAPFKQFITAGIDYARVIQARTYVADLRKANKKPMLMLMGPQ